MPSLANPGQSTLLRCMRAELSHESWRFVVYGLNDSELWSCSGSDYVALTENSVSWAWGEGEGGEVTGFAVEFLAHNERCRIASYLGKKTPSSNWIFNISRADSGLSMILEPMEK